MNTETRNTIGIYTILCTLYFITIALEANQIRVFAKAAPVIWLVIWLGKFEQVPASKLIRAGLALSVGGDILLELHDIRNHELRFLGGLACFLLAHICYIVFFAKQLVATGIKRTNNIAIAVVSAYSAIVLFWLSPHLGELFIPVIAYVFTITLMMIFAWLTSDQYRLISAEGQTNHLKQENFKHLSVLALLAGGLFVLSDSLLAARLFIWNENWLQVLVMLTYWAAQLLFAMLVFSLFKHRKFNGGA